MDRWSGLKLIVSGALVVAAVACGGSAPQPPIVTPPSGGETINGSERIGWDQPAGDTLALAAIHYVMYVDGVRRDLPNVNCSVTASANGYPCTAPLPSMNAGAHTLELASYVQDGALLESGRSAALDVTVVAAAAEERR